MDPEILPLIEKIRGEPDPFAKARQLHYLTKERDVRVKDLSKILGITSAYICNLMRIIRLPDIVVDGYYSKNVTLTHLLVLSRLKDISDMVSAYELILQKNLTVADVEELVRNHLYGILSGGKRVSEETVSKIEEIFQTIDRDLQVKITQTRIKATITLVSKGNLEKTSQILTRIADSKLKR